MMPDMSNEEFQRWERRYLLALTAVADVTHHVRTAFEQGGDDEIATRASLSSALEDLGDLKAEIEGMLQNMPEVGDVVRAYVTISQIRVRVGDEVEATRDLEYGNGLKVPAGTRGKIVRLFDDKSASVYWPGRGGVDTELALIRRFR